MRRTGVDDRSMVCGGNASWSPDECTDAGSKEYLLPTSLSIFQMTTSLCFVAESLPSLSILQMTIPICFVAEALPSSVNGVRGSRRATSQAGHAIAAATSAHDRGLDRGNCSIYYYFAFSCAGNCDVYHIFGRTWCRYYERRCIIPFGV